MANFELDVLLGPFDLEWLFAHSIAKHHAVVSARECVKRTERIDFIHRQILEDCWNSPRMWDLVSASAART